ncbi:fasciclin domain-containing protein [Sphingomonas sp. CROZ-RG-20F-R02-07]|uniref:fasciclin domain-containing protein n=1 Tax=Sphingomonas sp. CROZ-RG-20F-R02-07 TaxID=2914832 RepID=UPI001F5A43B9|nr:fasciclin domain-containing protein [Sphingomonas sp. CROZ-RG-20F-R02-07]
MTELSLIALAAALATGQAATPTAPAPMQAASAAAGTTAANPTVGGAAMLPTQTVVQNASAAPNLTTLVAAVKAAGLVPTLSGPGPFTVFAPTNDAFGHLAPGTVDNLLKPENKPTLVKVLTYHVVPGTITSAQLKQMVTAGGGTAKLTTVEGEPLTVTLVNNIVTLTDVHGNKSYVETADVKQANGVVHVVNGVVLPTVN